jgi:hypothetical protein
VRWVIKLVFVDYGLCEPAVRILDRTSSWHNLCHGNSWSSVALPGQRLSGRLGAVFLPAHGEHARGGWCRRARDELGAGLSDSVG